MTKAQKSRANHILCLYKAELADVAYAARALSAEIRCANTKSRNELITLAAGYPAIVQHSEFITG